MSCTVRTFVMYTIKYTRQVFNILSHYFFIRRIIQDIHYHQLVLVMFLMQSITLWPISTIFLSGIRNLDAAWMFMYRYPEQFNLHVIAYFKTHLSAISEKIYSDPNLRIFRYIKISRLSWKNHYFVNNRCKRRTYEAQPKNVIFLNEKIKILIEEQHSWTNQWTVEILHFIFGHVCNLKNNMNNDIARI